MSSSATSQSMTLNLAIAHGVPCLRLAHLFALQREQAPEVVVRVHEVSPGGLKAGIQDGAFDVGLSLANGVDPALLSEPLWRERMVAVVSAETTTMDEASLYLEDLFQFPVLRWSAETCDALERQISVLSAARARAIQEVTSFEMMALLVSAGYGVGITAESRSARSGGWDIRMRPISNGSYELATYLLLPAARSEPVAEQFVQRMRQFATSP